MKKIIIIASIIILAALAVVSFILSENENRQEILDQIARKKDKIVVDFPQVNSKIFSSPLRVSGMARGVWYFEASFPITLIDSNGKTIGMGIATAKDEWMTEDFVPFEGEIIFEKPTSSKKGMVIFTKDNPSGLPEHDDELRIPVYFE